jgi:uncharacterized protein (TIGR03492 family)
VDVKRLLVISNGHGEDSIGTAIVRRLPPSIRASAYPTLGSGAAYAEVCEIVGPRAQLASAGSRVSAGTFGKDLRGGLLGTIPPGIAFARTVRRDYDQVLVAGDFIGVLGCWLTGIRNIVWIDTYNTGYGRPYSGLERWIIAKTCRTAFVRHPALAEHLKRGGVDARAVGNVMMDTIPRTGMDLRPFRSRPLAVALLPGSRAETAANFALQIEAIRRLPDELKPDVFLALAPGIDPKPLAQAAHLEPQGDTMQGDVPVHLVRGALGDVIDASDVVLSQAGTATVQALGLGKPVISFTRPTDRMSRHRDESRLFGEARILVADDAGSISQVLSGMLRDPADRSRRGAVGVERIGPPGAIVAIIAELGH